MSSPAFKKIQEITQKMAILKEEQRKLQGVLEKTILDTLHKQDAFSYDGETLLAGISYVIDTMKRTDDQAKEICASWKKRYDHRRHTSPTHPSPSKTPKKHS